MKYIVIACLVSLGLVAQAQTNVVGYDYWFDTDYAGVTETSITPTQNYTLTTDISTTGLTEGLHTFHIRFEDENSVFSSTLSRFFFKSNMAAPGTNVMVAYEYWFDTDYASAVTTAMGGTADETVSFPLDANALSNGLHIINFRFKDSEGQWSSVISKFFFKMEPTVLPANEIVEYEFWFDADYASASSMSVPNAQDVAVLENIDASLLADGLHTFHIRFKDDRGNWSGALSKFFFKTAMNPSVANNIIRYEYWFDADYASAVSTSITAAANISTIENIDASTLANGLHSFHIRYLDENDQWSSVKSKFFFKTALNPSVANNIIRYEYWFDTDYASAVSTSITAAANISTIENIDASTLANGLHSFHIRYLDENDQWSSVKSKFFYHIENAPFVPALISAYRYWVDADFANHTHVDLATSVPELNLVDLLDLTQIPHGSHTLHFQFKDNNDLWSSVTTDTLEKISYPIAEFQANSTLICIGDEVAFINGSVDGDTYAWDFGDTGTSSDSSATHIYSTPGQFDVTLTVTDLITGADSTITLPNYITVGDLASPTLSYGLNDSICPGEQVTISAENGFSYAWNTLATTPTIVTSNAGEYYVLIADLVNPACITESDTVTIVVHPEPIVDLGTDIEQCAGIVTLDAQNPGDTYDWNDNSSLQTLEVSATGEYSVEVTNLFGCSESDTVFVTIHPLPDVDLGADIVQVNPPATLNAGAGFSQYDWSTLETTPTIEVTSNGSYWVEVTDANGCTDSDTINVTFTVGLIEELGMYFKAYPNPTKDRVTIQTSSYDENMSIHLTDALGKIVYESLMESSIVELDLSELMPGTYHVVFEKDGKGLARIPIVKL